MNEKLKEFREQLKTKTVEERQQAIDKFLKSVPITDLNFDIMRSELNKLRGRE